MKTFLLDTSTNFLVFGYSGDDKTFVSKTIDSLGKHKNILIDEIKKFFTEMSVTPNDIDKMIVGVGPGRYTGIRVGVTFAKTFAYSTKCLLYSFPSLDLLKTKDFKEGKNFCYSNAKKTAYFYKGFDVKGGVIVKETPEDILDIESFDKLVGNKMTITGDFSFSDISKIKLTKVSDLFSFAPNYLKKGFDLDV